MRKSILMISILLAASLPLSAQAGVFDLVSKATDSGSGGGDAVAQQDELVNAYIAANKEVLLAQYKMANALGAKEAAALAKAEADALSSGATKDNLSKADTVQSDVSKAITERQKVVGNTMDEAAKKEYASGLGSLGKGVLKYAGMATKFSAFKSSLTSISPMMLTKLNSGVYIVKSFPANSKNLYDTLGSSVSFAKSNDIPVPADATKAL
ncbi:hypothetical protein [uncultured Deefgea sp.]|uniref:hypothetical protein n=1 Tax=uncultured Deefgea sp. TaxID=1304914 RepID=UPI002621781D|nr:hypothetical protein [uncultured Deefgea sp.]